MADELMSLDEALEQSFDRYETQTVLLGNGFSMAFDADRFAYRRLFDEAEFRGLSVEKTALFTASRSYDFERVIDTMAIAADLADLYEPTQPALAAVLRADADAVRRGLADVLAARHPENAREIPGERYLAVRQFLANFDRIFTVNYDLLLYWAVNHAEDGADVVQADGFQWPTYEDRTTLVWKPELGRMQRIFYLHGALHLFVEKLEGNAERLHKLRYLPADPLVTQLRQRLEAGWYPLIVTEGTSDQKRVAIEGNEYLRFCRESLRSLQGALFVHGMALSANDGHILDLIADARSGVRALYVAVRRDSTTRDEVEARARRVKRRRSESGGERLRVRFYDAESTLIWGDNA